MIAARAAKLITALILGGLAAAVPAAASAASAHPHIAANPDNLMVNTDTTLTGTGWPANAKLRIRECSAKMWVVTQHVCLSKNSVTVTTSPAGRFRTRMTALVCPAAKDSRIAGFSRTCYVGVPHPSGVDTEMLAGAAKLIVTGP